MVNLSPNRYWKPRHGFVQEIRLECLIQKHPTYNKASLTRTSEFAGGTIYQAFLSALSYHRWHSPVSGKIVKTRLVDGSYYAEALSEGFDPAGPNNSQGYITQVASRALIFIEADNPDIGLMAVMFVGMVEVSTNEITVHEGQHVKKGDQLGMFHFGGSTHCLIFRLNVNVNFDLHGQSPGLHSTNIPVRARIATVGKQYLGNHNGTKELSKRSLKVKL